ncbi:MAG: hypothetical protein ICV72_00520 [Aldersonia sp.]|nr:hypothetical protein [Aldersonia sp.]
MSPGQSHSVEKRQSHSVARQQRLELLIGILGIFTVALFVSALGGIVLGEPSVMASMLLLAAIVLFALAICARRRA